MNGQPPTENSRVARDASKRHSVCYKLGTGLGTLGFHQGPGFPHTSVQDSLRSLIVVEAQSSGLAARCCVGSEMSSLTEFSVCGPQSFSQCYPVMSGVLQKSFM